MSETYEGDLNMAKSTASMPEIKAIRVPRERYDVAILGGGLAGLSLAAVNQ